MRFTWPGLNLLHLPALPLFKAINPHSNESIFFENSGNAKDWLANHHGWILKKREKTSE
jgi:hypothetical protein